VRSFTSVSKVSSGLFGAFDKHEKTVYKDDYGNVFYDKWDKEIDYFIEKMILTDREIYNLLWDSRDKMFYQICITIINNMIGRVTERTGT
jgi:hypothetical protein